MIPTQTAMLDNTGIPGARDATKAWADEQRAKRIERAERIAARNKADIDQLRSEVDDAQAAIEGNFDHPPSPIQIASISFNGTCYAPNGTPQTGLASDGTKPWLKFDASASSTPFSEETGPAPAPWPANEIWHQKAHVYGSWYVTRLG